MISASTSLGSWYPKVAALLLVLIAATGEAADLGANGSAARNEVYLVRDLRSEQGTNPLWIQAHGAIDFARSGELVLFRAWDGIHGWELWSTDGTREGTALLRDICPGECSSSPFELREMRG